MNAGERTKRLVRGDSAFTLIELMVSVFILCIIVLAIGRIVTDTNRAMEAGTRQAYVDGNARALMEIIVDDLSQAITDDSGRFFFSWSPKASITYHDDFLTDDICFTAVLGPAPTSAQPDHERTQITVRYFVESIPDSDPDNLNFYALRRGELYGTATKVEAPKTYPMLDYVVEFKLTLYDDQCRVMPSSGKITNLPSVAAIHLTLISQDAHLKASRISKGTDIAHARDYILKNSRRYFSMAYFPMRRSRAAKYNYRTTP